MALSQVRAATEAHPGSTEVGPPGRTFGGRKVNFVQIGLGTNCTFIQNLGGEPKDWHSEIHWLLKACSQWEASKITGVAVEPVEELVDGLREAAGRLPNVRLIQAAIGERDENDVDVNFFDPSSREAIVAPFSQEKRDELLWHFEYLLNMSCVGNQHPALREFNGHFLRDYGITISFESRKTDMWSWSKLAHVCGFSGVEVLVIDAEGHDVRILRSLIEHCRGREEAWPELIQFETMGHCDLLDGDQAEWNVIADLQVEGYVLVYSSFNNTILVHWTSLWYEPRVRNLVKDFKCIHCSRRLILPYRSVVEGKPGIYCHWCFRSGKPWGSGRHRRRRGGRSAAASARRSNPSAVPR